MARIPLMFVASGALVLATACGPSGFSEARPKNNGAGIDVRPAERFQTIDSWAVYARYWEDDKVNNRFDRSFEPYTEAISRFAVDEIGITGARVEIWSGAENPTDYWSQHVAGELSYTENKAHRYEKINDNDDPFSTDLSGFNFPRFDFQIEKTILPMQQAIAAKGEKMHINVNYVDFNGGHQGSLSHAQEPEEFAEFVLVFFERLRDRYGIIPDSFELILEPDNTRDWTGERIAQGLLAVERRLEENGFTPEFIAPSAADVSRGLGYFDSMIGVAGVSSALDVFSYHRYGGDSRSNIEAIRNRAWLHGMKTAMLEKGGAGIDVLFEDLTVGNVSAWQQWGLAQKDPDDRGGWYYVVADITDPEAPTFRPSRYAAHLAQVFRHVRRGAVRIGATSQGDATAAVAFINPDGSHVLVVRAQAGGGALRIRGLPDGRYGVRFVGADNVAQALPDVRVSGGRALKTSLPGAGTLAIYGL